jgi:hypothetical protein
MSYCKCKEPVVDGSYADGFYCTKCEKGIEPVDYDPSDFDIDDEPKNALD